VEVPFLATIPPTPGGTTYGCVPCDTPALAGFVRSDVSFLGKPERTVGPGEREIFERFLIVTNGDDAAATADVAYGLRGQLFGEAFATVVGRVSPSGDATRTSVVVEDLGGERMESPAPVTQASIASDGTFEARVPVGPTLDAVSLAFGREVDRAMVPAEGMELDVGTLDGGASGTLTVTANLDGAPTEALVALVPRDATTAADVRARRFGAGPACSPLVGPASAGRVACSRILAAPTATIEAPPGEYRVLGARGPFATLAVADVTIAAGGSTEATLDITSLALVPEGALSVDLHAHGPVSFDASAPVRDRVTAFAAADLDLVAMTDHDVLADYQSASDERVRIVTGLETTGQRPFALLPDAPARTIGRFGFLPLSPFESGPWRGAPADEEVEPGVLFTRVSSAGFDLDTGLIQLLRPWGQPVLGRDVGFPRAVGIDLDQPLPAEFDGSSPSLLRRTPDGALFANDDFHTVEVMSGVEPESFVAQRAVWHYFLAENLVRAATGGGGSHGIGEAVPGAPRTLVTPASAELADVLGAVRNGRALATNGPIIELTMMDPMGVEQRPSTTAFEAPTSPRIRVRVLAAPWIPVDEVRVVVNAQTLTTLTSELSVPPDPFGTEGVVRYDGEIDVTPGLALEFGDAFVIVEAGAALPTTGDLDCDGVPDTGDNDGDGDVDADDIGLVADDSTPSPAVTTVSDVCLPSAGPLRRASVPGDAADPRRLFHAVMGATPMATTNPLLLDVDGGGYSGAPRGVSP
jgi:hypothetical protein